MQRPRLSIVPAANGKGKNHRRVTLPPCARFGVTFMTAITPASSVHNICMYSLYALMLRLAMLAVIFTGETPWWFQIAAIPVITLPQDLFAKLVMFANAYVI